MKTIILVIIALLVGIAIGIGIYYYVQPKTKTGEPYIFSDTVEKAPEKEGFVDISSDTQILKNGKKHYTGKVTWNELSGANGAPAIVPVRAMLIYKAEKRLVILETKLTDKNGEFDFVFPTKYEIMLGSVISKARNMPPKVKQFFARQKKKPPTKI